MKLLTHAIRWMQHRGDRIISSHMMRARLTPKFVITANGSRFNRETGDYVRARQVWSVASERIDISTLRPLTSTEMRKPMEKEIESTAKILQNAQREAERYIERIAEAQKRHEAAVEALRAFDAKQKAKQP